MANTKFYTVEKEINGTKYVAQFSGISAALRAVDQSYIEGTNTTSTEKLAEYLFKYILVEPAGMTIDDFEDFLQELTFFIRQMEPMRRFLLKAAKHVENQRPEFEW